MQIVPSEAAAPALVIVGALMISQLRYLVWDDMALVIPAFLTIALMPFTYSITNGIGAGVISYVLLQSVTGGRRRIHPLMWLIAVDVRRLLRAATRCSSCSEDRPGAPLARDLRTGEGHARYRRRGAEHC